LLSFFFVSCFFSMIDVEASDAWALSGDYSSITVIDSNVCVCVRERERERERERD